MVRRGKTGFAFEAVAVKAIHCLFDRLSTTTGGVVGAAGSKLKAVAFTRRFSLIEVAVCPALYFAAAVGGGGLAAGLQMAPRFKNRSGCRRAGSLTTPQRYLLFQMS